MVPRWYRMVFYRTTSSIYPRQQLSWVYICIEFWKRYCLSLGQVIWRTQWSNVIATKVSKVPELWFSHKILFVPFIAPFVYIKRSEMQLLKLNIYSLAISKTKYSRVELNWKTGLNSLGVLSKTKHVSILICIYSLLKVCLMKKTVACNYYRTS